MFENDHYRYLWEGKVIKAGENPYVHAPDSKHLDDIEFVKKDKVAFGELSSIYPPLAQAVFFLVSPLKYKHALFTLQLVFLLALIWIVPYWFKESDKYFLILLPFLFKEYVQSIHIDMIAVVFFTLAIKHKKKHLFLLLSFLTKILSVIYVPFLFLEKLHKEKKVDLKFFILPVLLLVFLYLNHSGHSGSSAYIKKWYWNSSPMDLMMHLKFSFKWARYILLGLFAVSYLYALKKTVLDKRPQTLLFAFLFLFSPIVQPWYLLWLIPLISWNKSYYLYIASSVVAYMPYGFSQIHYQLGSLVSFCILSFAIYNDLKKVRT